MPAPAHTSLGDAQRTPFGRSGGRDAPCPLCIGVGQGIALSAEPD